MCKCGRLLSLKPPSSPCLLLSAFGLTPTTPSVRTFFVDDPFQMIFW